MGRKRELFLKYIIPRKKGVIIRICLISLTLWCLVCGWWLSDATSQAFLTTVDEQNLNHFIVNRNLKSYLDQIDVLIEPSSVSCSGVPLLVLVASAPAHSPRRRAVRRSWGAHFPTYFLLGAGKPSKEDLYAENYAEAKLYDDIIIYNFQDHYQNLTLKTALMLKWTLRRCSPRMLFKTDDDILVNPWIMNRVLQEYGDRDLVGRVQSSAARRDRRHRWHLPRRLFARAAVPAFLSGAGYLVNGKHIEAILTAAYKVPMINLEDVYFTFLVAKEKLNLTLSHDHRVSLSKLWFNLDCVYWGIASMHSFQPQEMINKWNIIKYLSNKLRNNGTVCNSFFSNIFLRLFLYG